MIVNFKLSQIVDVVSYLLIRNFITVLVGFYIRVSLFTLHNNITAHITMSSLTFICYSYASVSFVGCRASNICLSSIIPFCCCPVMLRCIDVRPYLYLCPSRKRSEK